MTEKAISQGLPAAADSRIDPAGSPDFLLKSHYSASELAEMRLQNLFVTSRNIKRRAALERWPYQNRRGRGGGVEYAVLSLPIDIQIAILKRCGRPIEATILRLTIKSKQPKKTGWLLLVNKALHKKIGKLLSCAYKWWNRWGKSL
jgi:hypothetical protein